MTAIVDFNPDRPISIFAKYVYCENCGSRAYASWLKGAYWCDSERCKMHIFKEGCA